jgi:general stress protein 26
MMTRLSADIIAFLQKQGFVVVSTLNQDASIHNSCKGIVDIDKSGKIYLLDLYQQRTLANLKNNQQISITAVDEHSFSGYCLKGKGRVVGINQITPQINLAWEEKISSRISQRIIKNIRGEPGHPRHPEANLPKPQYMILIEVKEIVDLTPGHIK